MKRTLSLLICILAFAAYAWAETPTLTYNKTVSYSPHPSAGNLYPAVTRANGGIVFTDGYEDDFFQVATPLTTDGTNDDQANSLKVGQVAGTTFGSGESFQGVCYDGASYFACGFTGTSCIAYKAVDPNTSGAQYTLTALTMPAGKFSGCTAVAANKIVAADADTGAIQFFTVTGATATADGSPIANGALDGYQTNSLYYYESGSTKVIFAYLVKDGTPTKTRRIDVFNTDGTAAGTSYAGTFCTALDSDFTVNAHYKLKFSGMAVSASRKILVASASLVTAGANGFDVFDISTITTNGTATPYQQVRASVSGDPFFAENVAGAAFFSVSASDYLFVTHKNRMSIYNVPQPPAAVNDWALYN